MYTNAFSTHITLTVTIALVLHFSFKLISVVFGDIQLFLLTNYMYSVQRYKVLQFQLVAKDEGRGALNHGDPKTGPYNLAKILIMVPNFA